MQLSLRTFTIAAAGALIASATSAQAASDPTGVWFDHNGRGAVEIAPCASGSGLCGYVVHIKDAKNQKRCGMQILGNVTNNGGGWIYSPDRGRKYSVALTRLNDSELRVVGNAGSMFSRTYTWQRAPDAVARCGETAAPKQIEATAPAAPAEERVAAVETPRPAYAPAPIITGSSSPSLALMGKPKKYATPVAATANDPAPAPARAVTQAAATPEKTAAAPPAAQPEAEETFEAAPERKCKFKIPYVGRVINVPCRD